jgi:hypothetical protein
MHTIPASPNSCCSHYIKTPGDASRMPAGRNLLRLAASAGFPVCRGRFMGLPGSRATLSRGGKNGPGSRP